MYVEILSPKTVCMLKSLVLGQWLSGGLSYGDTQCPGTWTLRNAQIGHSVLPLNLLLLGHYIKPYYNKL